MAGVQKVTLHDLNINIKNALVVGIIIAKNSARTIGSKKKNGESRAVTSFTLRDSAIDTINVDVWGPESFVLNFYERFLVGDVVDILSPKICIKTGENEIFRPLVSSPFYLSLNKDTSEVTTHSGETYSMYLPLLHIPSKHPSGYHGLDELIKLPGVDMAVRSVEIMDNTTPATLMLDIFDIDTIQRAEEWRPLESVLFIADARLSWRGRAVKVQICAKSVVTHQPHTADAESLRLYARSQANTRGGEAAAWSAWSGERVCAASVSQVRDRLATGEPFSASLHAVLTHLDLDDLVNFTGNNDAELRVRFADHTGELTARLPINILEDTIGYSSQQLKAASAEDRAAIRWKFLLEQCCAKLAGTSPRLLVLSLRRASPADPIPLY